ncbi:hypothetical protein [Chitinophaga pinensis]|uniref:Uncharacterized protein n=1 Tax=Chitinophaga pinensis (strain ATCC 43595 / DSM 2588 / LMG 13176 / NBRC 15968 / NCIMB 11800 / UQM 2034) TaxID=485918 RepID=A0A979GVB4_CHIPD|nr:hypothetical protein [Chitinophaga pinensis]ACU61264.1 hypothetical protein Cpin_3802 [Chitinophaga pinensis DSM 2588]
MKQMNETLNDQIARLNDNEDADGLIQLIQQLPPDQLQTHKTDLSDACESVFYIWLTDLQLGKIRQEDQASVITMLTALIQALEIVQPDTSHHLMSASLYEHLSDQQTAPAEKLVYIQQAIDEYTAGLQQHTMPLMQARLAGALLDRMEYTQDYKEKDLSDILQLFEAAFTSYDELILTYFLHGSFRLLSFQSDNNNNWHQRFLTSLETSLNAFAATDAFVCLEYVNALRRLLENQLYHISADYQALLNTKIITLLAQLKDYETKNEQRLNYLGQAFENVAERIAEPAARLAFYHAALAFFTQGQQINPAAWTFPVYATNVLMEMARIEPPEKVIPLFEQGKALFAFTYRYDSNFTLMHYWGKYLLEYAKQAYNFQAPDILKEAEEKLLAAKQMGNGYYDQPYRGLAKVALKLGNKQQCLDILAECKKVFTTDYHEYEHSFVLADEDFKEIWPDLNH